MNDHAPVERLIINLLALAEAAPTLPPEKLRQLALLADSVEPSLEALTAIGLRIHLTLMDQPVFVQAKQAWDQLAPERVSLSLKAIQESLTNPTEQPASGVEALAAVLAPVLRDAPALLTRRELLQKLASLLGLAWPRHPSSADDPAAAASESD
jgi:hypothetical protein